MNQTTSYDNRQRVAFFTAALERVRALPGVVAASAAVFRPLSGIVPGTSFLIEGQPRPEPGKMPVTAVGIVHPGYFETMGIRLLRGRTFRAGDTEDAPRTFVINESFAKKYWPNEDPLQHRIAVWMGDEVMGQVIGIVTDSRDVRLDQEPQPMAYFSHSHLSYYSTMTLLIRTSGDPLRLSQSVRQIIKDLDPNQPVADIETMEHALLASVSRDRFNMALLTVFGGLALVLASVGIYGVMSHAVTRRTHEMGIRLAIGAQRTDVLGLVLKQGMALAVAGLSLGLAVSFVLSRSMATLLFGVKPTDPLTFALTPVLLGAVALLAIYVPARRATKVDPMVALRYE